MRLINTQTMLMEDFSLSEKPPYAILSHTWEKDEISFQEFQSRSEETERKRGWWKIATTCWQARQDHISYAWIDTCCIDKASSAELSEAINSMFKWYRSSAVCYVYLADLGATTTISAEDLKPCRWWTRGWTLQELIAPEKQRFYDTRWTCIGDRESLSDILVVCSGIDTAAFTDPLGSFAVSTKMDWYGNRTTTRPEDQAYCQLGIFGINMPLLYGEGHRAFTRLQQMIFEENNDLSILAHVSPEGSCSIPLIASAPSEFVRVRFPLRAEFSLTSTKLQLSSVHIYLLNVQKLSYCIIIAQDERQCIVIPLRKIAPGVFRRHLSSISYINVDRFLESTEYLAICDIAREEMNIENFEFYHEAASSLEDGIHVPLVAQWKLLTVKPSHYWDWDDRITFGQHEPCGRAKVLVLELDVPKGNSSLRLLALIDHRSDPPKLKLLPVEATLCAETSRFVRFLLSVQNVTDGTSLSWAQVEFHFPRIEALGSTVCIGQSYISAELEETPFSHRSKGTRYWRLRLDVRLDEY